MTAKNQYKNFQFNLSNKKKKKQRFKALKSFFNDERLHKSVGLFLILLSIYLFIAFTSYLFSWKFDQSIIDGQPISFVFNGQETEVNNWLGKFGAYIAHRFLKIWYGIASFIFTFITFLIGFKALFKQDLLPLLKTLKISLISLLWLCMTLGFIFNHSELDFMGGLYGNIINNWLVSVFGAVGTGFFIIFSGFVAVILLFNPSLSWLITFFNKISDKLKQKKDPITNDGFTDVNSLRKEVKETELKTSGNIESEENPISEVLELETLDNTNETEEKRKL